MGLTDETVHELTSLCEYRQVRERRECVRLEGTKMERTAGPARRAEKSKVNFLVSSADKSSTLSQHPQHLTILCKVPFLYYQHQRDYPGNESFLNNSPKLTTRSRTSSKLHHVPPPPRPSNVPQSARHIPRTPLRQMRRQMPRLRLLRTTDNLGAHLRRVQLRQLPEQMHCLRRRGHQRRVLLL
jgi:hypothetical protein